MDGLQKILVDALIASLSLGLLVAVLVQVIKQLPYLRMWVNRRAIAQWQARRQTSVDAITAAFKENRKPAWMKTWGGSKAEWNLPSSEPSPSEPVLDLSWRFWTPAEEASSPKSGMPNERIALMPILAQPTDLLLKELQNIAAQVQEHPATFPRAFALISAGANPDDQLALLWFDQMATKDPSLIERLSPMDKAPSADADEAEADKAVDDDSSPPDALAAGVRAAQDRIAAAVDRNLDALQITLALRWPRTMFVLSIFLAMAIALSATTSGAIAQSPGLLLLMMVGVVGGVLATVVYDAFAFVSRLARQYQ